KRAGRPGISAFPALPLDFSRLGGTFHAGGMFPNCLIKQLEETMSQPDGFELEGRINGLREVVQMMLVHLTRQNAIDLRDELEERLVPSDQQEDPGAVPER